MKVFLDDERRTPNGWVRVYWPLEAITLLESGEVKVISLDHDLGNDRRGTGYDVVLWIEEAVATRGFKPPEILIHSANISAKKKMENAVASIARHSADNDRIDDLRNLLKVPQKFCLVGYGLSEESGIPHFCDVIRDECMQAFSQDISLTSSQKNQRVLEKLLGYKGLIAERLNSSPYRTLALLQKRLNLNVATQCFDGLSQINGIENAIELSGNMLAWRCQTCGAGFAMDFDCVPKRCASCGGRLWPDLGMLGGDDCRNLQEIWKQQLSADTLLLLIGADPKLAPFVNPQALELLPCKTLAVTAGEFRYFNGTRGGEIQCKVIQRIAERQGWSQEKGLPQQVGFIACMHYLLWLAKLDETDGEGY